MLKVSVKETFHVTMIFLFHIPTIVETMEPMSNGGIVVPDLSSLDEVARQALTNFNQQQGESSNTGNDAMVLPLH